MHDFTFFDMCQNIFVPFVTENVHNIRITFQDFSVPAIREFHRSYYNLYFFLDSLLNKM